MKSKWDCNATLDEIAPVTNACGQVGRVEMQH
jgi:hypothetical protein